MSRLGYKLVIAAVAFVAVEMVVFLAAQRSLISTSTMFFFTVVMLIAFTMVINLIRVLDARGRAKIR